MSKNVKKGVSALLCLIFALQMCIISGAVTNNLASVEIKGKTLTATLYDEDITQSTHFSKPDYTQEEIDMGLVKIFWDIAFSDGINRYCVYAHLSYDIFKNKNATSLNITDARVGMGLFDYSGVDIVYNHLTVDSSIKVENHKIIWTVTVPDEYTINNNLTIEGYEIVHDNHDIRFGDFWGTGYTNQDYPLNSYFADYDEPKYTKKANKNPEDKKAFVDNLLANELGAIRGTDKESEIKQKIYDLLFVAQYRPTVFGSKKSDIATWKYQNSGSNGTSHFDSGLNKTIKWTYSCRGCRSYSCFASQYVNGSNGSVDSGKTGCKVTRADDIKQLIETYADPGEPIHYDYTNSKGEHSNHVVAYVGCDNNGFYFLSYEGGKGDSGTWHLLDLKYVTYEKLAQSCKNYMLYVWDTNGGTYKENKSFNNPVITDVKFKITKFGAVSLPTGVTITYGNGKTGYIKGTSKSRSLNSQDAENSFEMHFNDNEYNTVKITADGKCTLNLTVEYYTADGLFSTRTLDNVILDQNKTATSNLYNCYDQGNLEIIDSKTGEREVWSCGRNQTVDKAEPELEFDPSGDYLPKTSIKNYVKEKTIDYKATITLTADTENMPSDARVVWLYQPITEDSPTYIVGDTLTIKNATTSFVAIAVICFDTGREPTGTDDVYAKSEIERVKVNDGFFARLIAFFRGLFGLLPVIEQ